MKSNILAIVLSSLLALPVFAAADIESATYYAESVLKVTVTDFKCQFVKEAKETPRTCTYSGFKEICKEYPPYVAKIGNCRTTFKVDKVYKGKSELLKQAFFKEDTMTYEVISHDGKKTLRGGKIGESRIVYLAGFEKDGNIATGVEGFAFDIFSTENEKLVWDSLRKQSEKGYETKCNASTFLGIWGRTGGHLEYDLYEAKSAWEIEVLDVSEMNSLDGTYSVKFKIKKVLKGDKFEKGKIRTITDWNKENVGPKWDRGSEYRERFKVGDKKTVLSIPTREITIIKHPTYTFRMPPNPQIVIVENYANLIPLMLNIMSRPEYSKPVKPVPVKN